MTTTSLPATTIVALRAWPVFASTRNCELPGPFPWAPLTIVIHGVPELEAQKHVEEVSMAIVMVSPAAATGTADGEAV